MLFLLLAIPTWIGVLTPGPRLVGPTGSWNSSSQEGCRGLADGRNGLCIPCFLFNPRGTRTNFRTRPLGLRVLSPGRGRTIVREIFKAMAVALFLPYIRAQARLPVGFIGLACPDRELPVHRGILLGGPFAASFTILVRGIGSTRPRGLDCSRWYDRVDGDRQGVEGQTLWKAKSKEISAIDIAEGVGSTLTGRGPFRVRRLQADLGGGDLPGINGI